MLVQLINEGISYHQTLERFMKKLCTKAWSDGTYHDSVYTMNGHEKREPSEEMFQSIFYRIWHYDPTHERINNPNIYTNWIITQYVNDGIQAWEDMPTIKDLLAEYDTLKKHKVFQGMVKAGVISAERLPAFNDITTIKGKTALFDVVQAGKKWRKKTEDTGIAEEFKKYLDEEAAGGIEIFYPKEGSDEERLAKFRKNGLVLWLKTMESSIKLFEKPTAWCTARGPHNNWFASYTRRGNLICIVDNANDKMYQFCASEDQFLDERDSTSYDALAIPFPLMSIAAKLCFPNLSTDADSLDVLLQLYEATGTHDTILPRMMAKLSKEGKQIGVGLWERMLKPNQTWNSFDVIPVITQYTNDTGHLPAEDEIVSFVEKLDGDALVGAAVAFLKHPYLQPSPKIIEMFMENDELLFAELIDLFYGTPNWKKTRAQIVRRIRSDAIRYVDAGYDDVYWARTRIPYRFHNANNPGPMTCMNWTTDDANWFISAAAKLNMPKTVLALVKFYLNRPFEPSGETVSAAIEYLKQDSINNHYKMAHLMVVIARDSKTNNLWGVVDPKFMANELSPNDGTTHYISLYCDMVKYAPWRQKMDADFFSLIMHGPLALEVFSILNSERAMMDHIRSSPAIVQAIKDSMIRALPYVKGTHGFNFLFSVSIFDPYFTIPDLRAIQAGMMAKAKNFSEYSGITTILEEFGGMVLRGNTTLPPTIIPEFCLRTLLLYQQHRAWAHDNVKFLRMYDGAGWPFPEWFWDGMAHFALTAPMKELTNLGIMPREKFLEYMERLNAPIEPGKEWDTVFQNANRYQHQDLPSE